MSLSYGQLVFFKSNKEYPCNYCEEVISPGELYVRRVGRKNKHYFNRRLHISCMYITLSEIAEKWADNRTNKKERKPLLEQREYRRNGMTPEQRKRREALHMYLNTRGRDALIKAYKAKSTYKVFKVMARMNKWLEELAAMGVPFSRSFVNDLGECRDLILKYDEKWYNSVSNTAEAYRWGKFIRSEDEYPYGPNWSVDDVVSEVEIPQLQEVS